MLMAHSLAFCEVDADFYDEGLIEMGNHLWMPVLLQHSTRCPCFDLEYMDDDGDDEAFDWVHG